MREADVFVCGTTSGIKTRIAQKWNKIETAALDFGTGYACSLALATLQKKAPFAAIAIEGIGLAVTCQAAKELICSSKTPGDIWRETWNSKREVEQNKKSASGCGASLVDMSLMVYGGFCGARRGYLNNHRDRVAHELFGETIKDQGIVSVRAGMSMGSGFAIDDSRLISNIHVVTHAGRDIGSTVNIRSVGGKRFTATVEDLHPELDIALLKTGNPHGLKPLKLAAPDKEIATGAELAAFRRSPLGFFQSAEGTFVKSGTIHEIAELGHNSLTKTQQLSCKTRNMLMRILLGKREIRDYGGYDDAIHGDAEFSIKEGLSRVMGVKPGWSGAPLIERKSGEVIGVVSGGYSHPIVRRLTTSQSVDGVHELLRLTRKS